jgi:DNA repair protein RadA/Sms
MAKHKTIFRCRSCARVEPRWLGRCTGCGAWNSYEEEHPAPERHLAPSSAQPIRLVEVAPAAGERIPTGIGELDRVLGGGLVPGSVTLLGGDPGIGKSTLLLTAAARLAAKGAVLYATAEESAQQTRLRANRLGIEARDLYVLAETRVEAILAAAKELSPTLLIVDSIQTVQTAAADSSAGGALQVRESAAGFVEFAKSSATPTLLVGHVTKDGLLAGPKTLEHLVDAVLSFEGERGYPYRILRGVKNRFGSTHEVGVFEMAEEGLQEVVSPSALFLAERSVDAPGSCVVASVEGSRPLLVEVQAILCGSPFGTPRRTATGFDAARAALLLAVLEKRAGLAVTHLDAFINVAGGIRLEERAADLGILAAAASSHANRPIPSGTLVFGEVGLAGEVRAVSRTELRVAEAARLGFRRCILPESSRERATSAGIELCGARNVQQALERLAII